MPTAQRWIYPATQGPVEEPSIFATRDSGPESWPPVVQPLFERPPSPATGPWNVFDPTIFASRDSDIAAWFPGLEEPPKAPAPTPPSGRWWDRASESRSAVRHAAKRAKEEPSGPSG